MKKLILFIAVAVPTVLVAQATIPGADFFFGQIDAIYSFLVILGGYVSFKIPYLNKIGDGIYRVLAFAIAAGFVFFIFGFNKDIISLFFSYFMSTSIYEVVLKKIFPSPKVGEAK